MPAQWILLSHVRTQFPLSSACDLWNDTRQGCRQFGALSEYSEQAYKDLASVVKPGRVVLILRNGEKLPGVLVCIMLITDKIPFTCISDIRIIILMDTETVEKFWNK